MKYKLSLQPYSPLLPVQQPQISELPVYDNNDKIIDKSSYIKLITAAQYFNPLKDSTGISEKKTKQIKPSTTGLFWTNSVSWNNGNGDYRKANELCTSCFCWRGRRLSFPPWHKYLPCNCEGLISPFWPWLWQCPSLQQKCSSQLFLHLREGDLTTLKRRIRRFNLKLYFKLFNINWQRV